MATAQQPWRRRTAAHGAALVVSATLALALAGCGGGGDTPTTTSVTTTTATATTTMVPVFNCTSSVSLNTSWTAIGQKGMAVDDMTLSQCPDELLGLWPHAGASRVSSLRLFAPWKPEWGLNDTKRNQTWLKLKRFVEATDAKVLLGSGVSCDSNSDDQQWQWALQLMDILGADRLMGVALGNEMDNFPNCIPGFWTGKFFGIFQKRVADMDAHGFSGVKVTTVWAMGAIAQHPFNGKIMSFLKQVHRTWGQRWAWTFNPYPIWDVSQFPTSKANCKAKTDGAVSMTYTINVMKETRKRMMEFTGMDNDTLWVGESGWSSPEVATQKAIANFCPYWAAQEVLMEYYQGIMAWNLSLPGVQGVDHLFYFTMRDACQNGICEHFGLVGKCGDASCKLQGPGVRGAPPDHEAMPSTLVTV
mmetsp:Transcript_158060/g.484411  ORF Transcript_158060/g.484411 Transcript_158060/m.484411 type:complete len:417 (+) Transcript_158060:76-1326(+)